MTRVFWTCEVTDSLSGWVIADKPLQEEKLATIIYISTAHMCIWNKVAIKECLNVSVHRDKHYIYPYIEQWTLECGMIEPAVMCSDIAQYLPRTKYLISLFIKRLLRRYNIPLCRNGGEISEIPPYRTSTCWDAHHSHLYCTSSKHCRELQSPKKENLNSLCASRSVKPGNPPLGSQRSSHTQWFSETSELCSSMLHRYIRGHSELIVSRHFSPSRQTDHGDMMSWLFRDIRSLTLKEGRY